MFDQQQNKSLLLHVYFQVLFCLRRTYSNLDFETKIVEIHKELTEIHCFEAEHSKFYKPCFGQFSNCLPALLWSLILESVQEG